MTPDSADSTGKGTRIWFGNDSGLALSRVAMARSQRPLRFSQSSRTICGRGYSGRAFCAETSFAQRVLSGPAAGCHLVSWHHVPNTKQIVKETIISVLFI